MCLYSALEFESPGLFLRGVLLNSHVHDAKTKQSVCNLESISAVTGIYSRGKLLSLSVMQAVNIMSTVGGLVTRTSVIDNASVNVIPLADGKMFTSTGVFRHRRCMHTYFLESSTVRSQF